jgi:hypothetical protein
VLRQPGRQVLGAAEIQQGQPQGLQLLAAQLQLGLGSHMAVLFAHVGLEEPISEWRGVKPVPAPFES